MATLTAQGASAASGPYDYSINFDGQERTYQAHVPVGYDTNSPMPLVIFLHRGGGSNESMHKDGWNKASYTYQFILAAPNGTGRLRNMILTWNAGAWNGGE